jgi:hypothetical protein
MAVKIPIWIVTPLEFMIILAHGNNEYTHNSILMELGGIALVNLVSSTIFETTLQLYLILIYTSIWSVI